MARDFYRFRRTRMENLSALKGADSWYAITDAHDEPLFACHVVGSCLGGTTTFHAAEGDAEVVRVSDAEAIADEESRGGLSPSLREALWGPWLARRWPELTGR